jgi:glutamate N-acetyltransferase / amino-acid N-acetyltransferase
MSDNVLPAGFSAAGIASGMKAGGEPDIAIILSERPAACAGMFTTNKVCGAPVTVTRRHVADGTARAILANAGNSNACTGVQGERDALSMCKILADEIGTGPSDILVASTGVIGRPLPMNLIEGGIRTAYGQVTRGGLEIAARAIMTTDTVPKLSTRVVNLGPTSFTVTGMCKGSGMIAPNLATMLAFIVTDAEVSSAQLREILAECVEKTFNRVTVDGDTSTSDMVLAMANGASDCGPIEPGTVKYQAFAGAIEEICSDLAEAIARDGEGATKFVTVQVNGAPSDADAHRAAKTVAESPLVKTAIFGGDPNWGRIAMALGRSGVEFDQAKLSISVGNLLLFKGGMPTAFDQKEAERLFAEKTLDITADLGNGNGSAEMWTCDLSYDYVKINAEYTT